MQLQTTYSESERKFPNEYTDVICIQIDQHVKKLLPKYKGVQILWNTVQYNVAWADVYFRTKRRLHPSSHLATIDVPKIGGVGVSFFCWGGS